MENSEYSIFYEKYYIPFFTKVASYIPSYITPNMITILNALIVLTTFINNLYYNPIILSLTIFMYSFLDNLDGIYARISNQTSLTGEVLDHGNDSIIGIILLIMLLIIYIIL